MPNRTRRGRPPQPPPPAPLPLPPTHPAAPATDERDHVKWSTLPLWLIIAVGCVTGGYFLLVESEPIAERGMGVIKETALGVEVALPVDAPICCVSPPTFSYFMTPAEYFDDEDPGPLIEVQMGTQEKTGTVRLSLTHMLGKYCKLFAGPATKFQIGSSVNFEANETIQPNITLEEVGEEDIIDENTFRAIERKWFSTNVNLNMPHTRYTVHCPITAVPDYESVVLRRISFVGARANLIRWKQSLPKGNYSSPGPDDTLAMVRFILDDAEDPSYEGSIAGNSELVPPIATDCPLRTDLQAYDG